MNGPLSATAFRIPCALVNGVGLIAFFLIALHPIHAQEIRRYVSSKQGDRLALAPAIAFTANEGKADTFRIDDSIEYQTIIGFGASFLEAGMICINSLAPIAQERVLQRLFDPAEGAGFSAMKTPLAGTDFMSAGPWYTYDDTPNDVTMSHFTVERDLGPNGLITYIQRARKYGKFVLQAPMDYPPDWMLVDVQKNQDIDPQSFPALARYYVKYLQEYARHGVVVDNLSLFNEPGVYTKIHYDKIGELLKNHVGPLLKKEGLTTKLQLSEAPTRENAGKNYPTILDDPEARKFVSAIPYHGYDHKNFDQIVQLHNRYPNLSLWMTEICHAYEAGTPKTMKLPRLDFEDGDFWAQQIISDLEAHASAWIYWNMILDQGGGPWLVSPIHGNPEDNVQHPVVVIDRRTQDVTYTGLYYYLAHFSKFVRPGAVRVKSSGNYRGLRCIAFKTPDRGFALQLLNSRDESAEVQVLWRGRSFSFNAAPISISTCLWRESP